MNCSQQLYMVVVCCQVISLTGRVLGTSELSVIDDTVIIDRLDVELVSNVQMSVEAKSDFPGAIAAQVTKTYRLHSYLQVLGTLPSVSATLCGFRELYNTPCPEKKQTSSSSTISLAFLYGFS